jgi:hypothetical protein
LAFWNLKLESTKKKWAKIFNDDVSFLWIWNKGHSDYGKEHLKYYQNILSSISINKLYSIFRLKIAVENDNISLMLASQIPTLIQTHKMWFSSFFCMPSWCFLQIIYCKLISQRIRRPVKSSKIETELVQCHMIVNRIDFILKKCWSQTQTQTNTKKSLFEQQFVKRNFRWRNGKTKVFNFHDSNPGLHWSVGNTTFSNFVHLKHRKTYLVTASVLYVELWLIDYWLIYYLSISLLNKCQYSI